MPIFLRLLRVLVSAAVLAGVVSLLVVVPRGCGARVGRVLIPTVGARLPGTCAGNASCRP